MMSITDRCTVCNSSQGVTPKFLFDKKILVCAVCLNWLEYNIDRAIKTRRYYVEEKLRDGKN